MLNMFGVFNTAQMTVVQGCLCQEQILVRNWNVSNRSTMPFGNLAGFTISRADFDRCRAAVDLTGAQN